MVFSHNLCVMPKKLIRQSSVANKSSEYQIYACLSRRSGRSYWNGYFFRMP
jgi:hypothetical protein